MGSCTRKYIGESRTNAPLMKRGRAQMPGATQVSDPLNMQRATSRSHDRQSLTQQLQKLRDQSDVFVAARHVRSEGTLRMALANVMHSNRGDH